MTLDEHTGQFNIAVKSIAGVVGLMAAVFALLSILLPPSLVQPIGTLVIGLVFTAILVWMGKIDRITALATWLAVSIGIIALYLLVSQPATVIGSVLDRAGASAEGLTLILTDADGVDHKAVSDEYGAFEIRNVPEGKFTILANGELLLSGHVPSGWKRMTGHQMNTGALVYRPDMTTAAPTPGTPVASTGAPTMAPNAIVNTDSLAGWTPTADGLSDINISLVPGRTADAVSVSYQVADASYVVIAHDIDPSVLIGTGGISFYYRGGGAANTIEFKLILAYPGDAGDTTYGVNFHQATDTGDTWRFAQVLYDDLECWWPAENCQNHPRPDLSHVLRIDFAISDKPAFGDQGGVGWVVFDDVVGIQP